jgi:hypothetical protein
VTRRGSATCILAWVDSAKPGEEDPRAVTGVVAAIEKAIVVRYRGIDRHKQVTGYRVHRV